MDIRNFFPEYKICPTCSHRKKITKQKPYKNKTEEQKEKHKETVKRYYEKNREKVIKQKREYQARKRKELIELFIKEHGILSPSQEQQLNTL